MSNLPPPTDPTPYVSAQQQTTAIPKSPKQWTRITLTILPFLVYLLAQRILLPTYHAVDAKGMRDWSDSNNIVSVGIMPWIIAAVIVEIVTHVFSGGQRVRHDEAMRHAELRRTTNIIGLPIAVVHAAWVTWDLTDLHIGIFDASNPASFFGRPHVSSPLLAFVTLLGGAIGLKLFVDFIGPRSFLGTHGRLLAVGLLLSTIYTLSRDNSPFDTFDIEITAIVRIAVNLLKCGMLVSFFLLKPPFLPQRTITA